MRVAVVGGGISGLSCAYYLQRAGIGQGECFELWNLTHPEKVRAIHQAYVDAGAECLLTNTFQANPHALARQGRAVHCDRHLRGDAV